MGILRLIGRRRHVHVKYRNAVSGRAEVDRKFRDSNRRVGGRWEGGKFGVAFHRVFQRAATKYRVSFNEVRIASSCLRFRYILCPSLRLTFQITLVRTLARECTLRDSSEGFRFACRETYTVALCKRTYALAAARVKKRRETFDLVFAALGSPYLAPARLQNERKKEKKKIRGDRWTATRSDHFHL